LLSSLAILSLYASDTKDNKKTIQMLEQSPYKEDANLKNYNNTLKVKDGVIIIDHILILVMIIIQKPSTQRKTLKKIITTLKKINLICLMIIL
ncbi:hypothetical protein Y873_09120, partial [Campylobacter jejuni CVM 41934]